MNRWLTSLLLFAALGARAGGRADQLAAAGVAEFTAAYRAWDGARFSAAAELFRQASTNASATGTHFYWLGTALFHRVLQLQHAPGNPTNQPAAKAALDAAVEALNVAVKLDGQHAESHALLGTLYGMKIDGNILRGLRFGPRVEKHRKQAMQYGADNPRVRYLVGTCQFHTAGKPAALREALASFQAAEQLFVAEARRAGGPLEPRWGHSSCLSFMGRACESLGRPTEAAAYFRQALAMHPADHVAKEGLARVQERK